MVNISSSSLLCSRSKSSNRVRRPQGGSEEILSKRTRRSTPRKTGHKLQEQKLQ